MPDSNQSHGLSDGGFAATPASTSSKRIFIATLGTRGEVQPVVALALALRALGHTAILCVPPNNQSWVESFGLICIPIGPDIQKWSRATAQAQQQKTKADKAQLRKIMRDSVRGNIREQFKVTLPAAKDCDLVLVCGGLQCAGRSVAEVLGIPYVYAAYCAVTLPSPNHPPPKALSQTLPGLINRFHWMTYDRTWNKLFRDAVNEERKSLGLAPVRSVPQHIFTDHPWLAADSILSPAGSPIGKTHVHQTGAWLLSDPTPLPAQLEEFLAAGDAPIYFGFGSMQAPQETTAMLIESARAMGRRVVLSQGWANLQLPDTGVDCISIGDVNHEKLFSRVAAIVHHGGAGTATVAARAGKPQIIAPHMYDQHYWGHRVQQLGIGVSLPPLAKLNGDALTDALRKILSIDVVERAAAMANRIELHGARVAAEQLVNVIGRGNKLSMLKNK